MSITAPRFGANYTPSKDWFFGWYDLDLDAASRDFDQLAALGLDHIRMFTLWPQLQPNRSFIAPSVLDQLAELVRRAKAAGLDTNVDVLQGHMSGMEFMPVWLSTRHRRSIYADPDVVAAEEELLTAVAARLRDEPGFLGITLGNEMNLLITEYPTDNAEVQAWLPRLLAACRRGAPDGTHLHSTYDAVFYVPDHPFTPAQVGGFGDIAAVHSWVFNGTVQRYGSGSEPVRRHAEYLIEQASAHLSDPARPVWLQEVGAPRPLIADADLAEFVHATVRNALDCPALWGITWWSSHAVSRRFSDFNDLEHTLGLYGEDGRITETGEAFAAAVARARRAPAAPAPRETALLLPDERTSDPRADYGPGGVIFEAWMRLAVAGRRPALVRPADVESGAAARRGITTILRPGGRIVNQDHHFPRYHLRSPSGYVNDPNGPILIDGVYHLYFQFVQDTPREGPVHWGHATSTDLVEWTVHPPALRAEPGAPDAGGCWSGNTVVANDRLYAFYSVLEPGNPFQPVFRAESVDGGATFGDRVRAVAGPDPAEQALQFRDPFVWRHFGRWCMVAGAELPGDVGQARLYESDDLESWRYIGPFVQSRGSRAEGAMWECPQYATFGDEGVLLIAAYHPRGDVRHVIALRGRESATALVDSTVSRLDAGLSFYAPSVLRGTDRNLVWGWATEERHRDWDIEADWSGCLTLPRELRLGGDGAVLSLPAAELTGLRDGVIDRTAVPGQFEVELAMQSPQGGAASVLTLTAAADEQVLLTVEWGTGRVIVDRSAASRDDRAFGGSSEFVDPQILAERKVGLRWFVDGSIGELFSDSGRVLTHRLYPTQPPPWRLTLEPGGATDTELTVHRIRDAVRF